MFKKLQSTIHRSSSFRTPSTIVSKSCKTFSSYNGIHPDDAPRLFKSEQLINSYKYYESLQKFSYPDLEFKFKYLKERYDDICHNEHRSDKKQTNEDRLQKQMNEDRLQKQINLIRDRMILDDLLKNNGGLKNTMKFFPEYCFEYIYDDEISAELLHRLHQAVQDTPGARYWIINDGKIYSNNPIIDALSKHPLVSSYGHSGGSMRWSIGVLKYVYTKGWDEFINKIITVDRT
jgi:hypothetical protein